MCRSEIGVVSAIWLLFCMAISQASAHSASGIVVNAKGEVFYIDTGHGVCKIDQDNRVTSIHMVAGGGHFLALDPDGKFSGQFPRLVEKLVVDTGKSTLLYASGGAPLVVNADGNLYYGSGFPGGEDTAPGFLTVTRLTADGQRSLFAPELKAKLAELNEGVMGLVAGPEGSLFVSCPNAILKVKMDGTVTTFAHPIMVNDCVDDLAKGSHSAAYHSPYVRGLDVTEDETVYAAVTGCRCVV